jgi:hypothetical protein
MVQAAHSFTNLGLPVLVFLPNVPLVPAASGAINFLGYAPRGLGLGDFFFAGVLAVQTYNKFGRKVAFAAVGAMAIAFGIWEAFLGGIITWFASIGHPSGGFPGTLMIISGWAPVIVWAVLLHRAEKRVQPPVTQQPSSSPTISPENVLS